MKFNFNLDYLKDEKINDWKIETFEIPEYYAKLRNLFEKNYLMHLEHGKFKKLTYKGNIIMSNTAMEQKTHIVAINKARGNVLVAGLGLGMYLQNIKGKKEVISITVIEKSKEVIELIGKDYKDNKKIKIINEDIFNYTSDIRFDFAFFDIWSNISNENLKEFRKLKRKFKNIPNMIFWSEDIIKINQILQMKDYEKIR